LLSGPRVRAVMAALTWDLAGIALTLTLSRAYRLMGAKHAHICCSSGKECLPSLSEFPRRWPPNSLSRKAFAVKSLRSSKTHTARLARQQKLVARDAAFRCFPNPSRVVTSEPATDCTGVMHERIACPFTITVQASALTKTTTKLRSAQRKIIAQHVQQRGLWDRHPRRVYYR